MASRRTRWAGAASALVLIAACSSDPADESSSAVLEAQVRAVQDGWGREAPTTLAPVTLPKGWRYLSAGGSTDRQTSDLTLDFIKTASDRQPLPAVTVCIAATEATGSCRSEDGLRRVEIPTASQRHSAVMVGSTDAVSEWAGIQWTTDLEAVDW